MQQLELEAGTKLYFEEGKLNHQDDAYAPACSEQQGAPLC
jgi:hypothetical protein